MNANGALQTVIPAGSQTIDMSSYAAGAYFLKYYFGGFSKIEKVIKK